MGAGLGDPQVYKFEHVQVVVTWATPPPPPPTPPLNDRNDLPATSLAVIINSSFFCSRNGVFQLHLYSWPWIKANNLLGKQISFVDSWWVMMPGIVRTAKGDSKEQ